MQNTIRQKLNPLIYVDLHNVTLPTKDGSTQIDHLIFSPYGLFVLETKNYQGWIFGTEKQARWTQQIYKKRTSFPSPLRQNYKHTKTLQDLLGLDAEHVHSVVAFVGDCEFKTEMPAHVTRGNGFVAYIQSFTQTVWQPEQMQALLDKLEAVRLQPGRATNRQHVAHVKELQAGKAERKPARGSKALAEAAIVTRVEPGAVDVSWAPAIVESSAPEMAPPPASEPRPESVAPQPLNEVPVCPQCAWPLRKLLMQRGPLAGQGIWRCTNGAACSFVRAAEPAA